METKREAINALPWGETVCREPQASPAAYEVEVTCPVCLNTYDHKDAPEEWLRVHRHLITPDAVNPQGALLQAAHWLRAGAPGRALETIEAALTKGAL